MHGKSMHTAFVDTHKQTEKFHRLKDNCCTVSSVCAVQVCKKLLLSPQKGSAEETLLSQWNTVCTRSSIFHSNLICKPELVFSAEDSGSFPCKAAASTSPLGEKMASYAKEQQNKSTLCAAKYLTNYETNTFCLRNTLPHATTKKSTPYKDRAL